MKKICLIGATNTGKSTLTKRLSQYFECKSITDFSEYHFKNQRLNHSNEDVSENDILVIANGQRELEKFIIGNDDDNDSMVISDTDIIYTKYLSIYHLGTYPKILDKYISEQSYDLYLLLNNDVSSIKGNTMISPKTRNWQFNCLKVQLDSLGKDYAIIEGKDHDERFVDCLNQIELIL